jgi:hypothetical protein
LGLGARLRQDRVRHHVDQHGAAGSDAFALKLKPSCAAFVTRFGPASWYMYHGELVLNPRTGRLWHFENWQRVPKGAEPIMPVRVGQRYETTHGLTPLLEVETRLAP